MFIVLGYRQLSADSKLKNYIRPRGAKGSEQQTGNNLMIYILLSEIHRVTRLFLVWLTTGSNSADINRFRSHTGVGDYSYLYHVC